MRLDPEAVHPSEQFYFRRDRAFGNPVIEANPGPI